MRVRPLMTVPMASQTCKGALGADRLKALLDPTTYVGLAPEIVESLLDKIRASGWLD